jgi:hypothetical protein
LSELHKRVGVGGIALLPIVCCLGVPLLLAAGVGAVALVSGGVIVGTLALLAAVAYLVRRRSHREGGQREP